MIPALRGKKSNYLHMQGREVSTFLHRRGIRNCRNFRGDAADSGDLPAVLLGLHLARILRAGAWPARRLRVLFEIVGENQVWHCASIGQRCIRHDDAGSGTAIDASRFDIDGGGDECGSNLHWGE